jgi:hypothetical protein
MTKVLPLGTEYEQQFPLSRCSSDTCHAHIFTYRVVGHSRIQPTESPHYVVMGCILHPMKDRFRQVTRFWFDGRDAYGTQVMRADFYGDPPSPTYDELLEKIGIEITDPTPEDIAKANADAAQEESVIWSKANDHLPRGKGEYRGMVTWDFR